MARNARGVEELSWTLRMTRFDPIKALACGALLAAGIWAALVVLILLGMALE